MCGIAGIWGPNRGAGETALAAMLAAQSQRGPDDEGRKTLDLPAGSLVLGHRRLSILDLSPAGHQPMENPERGDWIVFNGEIYNFLELREELAATGVQFRSRCDTEVILQAYARWGTDAFNRLAGMFALGLYDRAANRLVLARDPIGIKPLYYAWGQDAFVFASELRAIEVSGLVDRSLDRRALAGLLAYGAVPGPLTMLRDAKSLDPGTWAAIDLNRPSWSDRRLAPVRYWDFPMPHERATTNGVGAAIREADRELLARAVGSHLISDVPVGIFLSSGIDSTALAVWCAEARGGDVDTFTIVLADEPGMDEGPLAAGTAKQLGTHHHEVVVTEAEARGLTEHWLGSLDQPSLDGLNTFVISHAVRQRGIIVALSGLGGDEVFGGYSTFRDVPKLVRMARAAHRVPRPVRTGVASWLYRNKVKAQRTKLVEMAGTEPSLQALYFRRRRLFSDAELHALGFHASDLGLNDYFLPPESEPERALVENDPVASISVLESRFYMGNMLLRDSDVFGMAHGLEIRVPLLDRRVLDRFYAVPGSERVVRGAPNKHLLVEALPKQPAPEILTQGKRGFSLPQASWMAGPLRPRFEELLDSAGRSGWLDPVGVKTVWSDFLVDTTGPTWSRAWLLGVLGQWLQRAN